MPIDAKMGSLLSRRWKTLIAVNMSGELSTSFRETAYTSGHVLKLESNKGTILDVFVKLLESFHCAVLLIAAFLFAVSNPNETFSYKAECMVAPRCLRICCVTTGRHLHIVAVGQDRYSSRTR